MRRLVLAVGVLVVAVSVPACGKHKATVGSSSHPSTVDGDCRLDDRFDPGQSHVVNGTPVTYQVQPPSGGNHWQSPLPPGVYTPDQQVPEAPAVHSLEHGYIDVWYRVGIDKATVDKLAAYVRRTQPDTLLLPVANLPVPVAATAWHHRLLCSSADLSAIDRFETRWVNQGPEKIPH